MRLRGSPLPCGPVAVCLLASLVGAGCKSSERPAAAERRSAPPSYDAKLVADGRSMFHRGVTDDGEPLRAFLGEDRIELTGRAAACANCHHSSGQGTQEGGVAAPNITASALFEPRAGASATDRPAYDEPTLATALRIGRSPTGRPLSIAMPRFELSPRQSAALLAYLRVLGTERAPGVQPRVVRVGVALPLSGPLSEAGQDAKAVFVAASKELEERGGIYQRRIEWVFADSSRHGSSRAVDALLAEDVLAVVLSADPGGAREDETARRLERDRVPALVPFGFPHEEEPSSDAPVFSLYPGLALQARLAVQEATSTDGDGPDGTLPLALVRSRDSEGELWAAGARAEAERRGASVAVERVFDRGALDAAASAQAIAAARPMAVLFQGAPSDLGALVSAMNGEGERWRIFAPSVLLSRPDGDPQAHHGDVAFVSPVLVGDELQLRARPLARFLERNDLPPRHLAFQASAFAATRILEEGLKRAGATLTREGLIAALESLREFDTGATPPVTFGVSRRTGIRGASLVRWDATTQSFAPASPWAELSP